jgi:archaellum component FlaC
VDIKQALNKLEEYVLNNPINEMEQIYLTISKEFNELSEQLEKVSLEKAEIEEELEERKEIMWNNPDYRKSLVESILLKTV